MTFPLKPNQFFVRLMYPLMPSGLRDNFMMMAKNSFINRNKTTVMFRLLSLIAVSSALFVAAGWKGIIFAWLLPLLTIYPLFSWIALLTEHRWFICGSSVNRRDLELIVGRPTDYIGISGFLVRLLIAPSSDAYHLVHSLYSGVRWNYLPAIDHVLKIEDPEYTRFASQGLFFSRDGIPSALSELRERLTRISPN